MKEWRVDQADQHWVVLWPNGRELVTFSSKREALEYIAHNEPEWETARIVIYAEDGHVEVLKVLPGASV